MKLKFLNFLVNKFINFIVNKFKNFIVNKFINLLYILNFTKKIKNKTRTKIYLKKFRDFKQFYILWKIKLNKMKKFNQKTNKQLLM